jgi:hypothetical protein
VHRDARVTRRGQNAQHGARDHAAAPRERFTGLRVVARREDRIARAHRLVDADRTRLKRHVFERHHRIASQRQRCARRDRGRGASYVHARPGRGVRRTRDRQRSRQHEQIGRCHRIAVHRRTRERHQRFLRDNIPGQHAPERRVEPDCLGR